MIELSVIIPVYKSEQTLSLLVDKLESELSSIAFEVVLVNDGSPDDSERICAELVQKYSNITFISLRKNFGEFSAVMAGLNHIKGNFAVMIDDDFQNPPSEILKLLKTIKEGDFDVVYSQYEDKKHSFFRNFGSWTINKMNNLLLSKPKGLYLSSFKIISKDVVQEIIKYTGSNPYIDALIFRVTNNVGKVFVTHNERHEGESSYTIKKLISLFMSAIFGYSTFPIRFCWSLGIGLIILWIALVFYSLFTQRFDSQSLILLVFVLVVAFQFIFLGVLGEYIGRSFLQQGGKPQFIIKKILTKK